ncbi:unnamed protein product [Lampetra fluviatilis]
MGPPTLAPSLRDMLVLLASEPHVVKPLCSALTFILGTNHNPLNRSFPACLRAELLLAASRANLSCSSVCDMGFGTTDSFRGGRNRN